MPPKQLLSDSDGSDGELEFKINKEYAAKHQHQQELAERFRLEAKYGKEATLEDAEASDSSEDVTEDEDGDQVTAEMDAAILRTLIKIRKGAKEVYDPSVRLFEQERQNLAPAPEFSTRSTGKKVTLAQFQRERVAEALKDEEHAAERLADATIVPSKRLGNLTEENVPRTHAQEEEELRRETLAAFHADDQEDDPEADTESGGLFTKRSADAGDSYREYLLNALGGDQAAVDEVLRERAAEARKIIVDEDDPVPEAGDKATPAGSSKTKSKEEADQEFLMNYILNRGWVEGGAPAKRDWDAEAAELESDASFASHADEWETEFNLRFENEANGVAVPSFSRDAAAVNSVRREDNKRKRQREERNARKAAEKQEKLQELERLQHLKRKDILERLEQLRRVTGNKNIGVNDLDLEGEFDPESHDQAMSKAFNEDYYDAPDDDEDGLRFDEDGKPVWDDDIDIGDILAEEEAYEREHETAQDRRRKAKSENKKVKKSHTGAESEDEDRIEMDADFVDGHQPEDTSKLSKKERKKLKKKAKKEAEQAAKRGDDEGVDLDEMDADQRPARKPVQTEEDLANLDPEERKRAISKMIDEYYATGAEDMIGDMPTRFKYVQVPKSSYGMTPVEILLADDKELNQVVGVKHLQPYRREIGKSTKPQYLSRKLKDFRHRLASKHDDGAGLGGAYAKAAGEGAEGAPEEKKKRKGKKQREQEKKRRAEEEQSRAEKKKKMKTDN